MIAFQYGVSEALEFDTQRGRIRGASALQLLQVSCACCPTAGITRNVTLMGISGFSRGRRVKVQAQPFWKENRSVQEVLFTTCEQKGTVCQIFISTGLVHKSRAADVGELPLSLPGSTKDSWIK